MNSENRKRSEMTPLKVGAVFWLHVADSARAILRVPHRRSENGRHDPWSMAPSSSPV